MSNEQLTDGDVIDACANCGVWVPRADAVISDSGNYCTMKCANFESPFTGVLSADSGKI